MPSAPPRERAERLRRLPSPATLAGPLITALVAAGIFGLALDAGGYALTTRNALAVGVWWTLALTVGLGLLPQGRIPRAALATGAMLAALAGWTALSIAWSDSAERAFAEFNRVSLYVGVFALAVAAARGGSLRRFTDGMALGIAAVGLLALCSRLFSGLVDEGQLFQFLPGGENRLSYPLEYWNGLGIFVGLAFPLLLGIALASRRSLVRAAAVGVLPALAATIYLTSSRGGAATAVVGTIAFIALTERRLAATGALLCAASGSAAAVAVLLARSELVDGPLQSSAASDQGQSAALLIALICIGTALVLFAGERLFGDARIPPPARGARLSVAAMAVIAAVAGAVAIDPVERFDTFKKPPSEFRQAEVDYTRAHLLSGSGSGRWQFWSAAADEFETRPLVGRGAGSYESWWAQHGSLYRFIRDAHSLYLETLAELGLVGLALLMAVLGAGFAFAIARLRALRGPDRVILASLIALLAAWCVAAGIDWMWELTVVTVVAVAALALMTGAATAPGTSSQSTAATPHRRLRLPAGLPLAGGRALPGRNFWVRAGVVLLAVAVIVTEGIPLLAQDKIRDSQAAVARGDAAAAVKAAEDAGDIQPWASSPYLQLALVREQAGDLREARSAIRDAISNDSSDWRLWLVRARVETKDGALDAARRSLRRARELNPRSPLFASG